MFSIWVFSQLLRGVLLYIFCQLPLEVNVLGIKLPTVVITTAILVFISLILAFKGGQVSLIITDFIQWDSYRLYVCSCWLLNLCCC